MKLYLSELLVIMAAAVLVASEPAIAQPAPSAAEAAGRIIRLRPGEMALDRPFQPRYTMPPMLRGMLSKDAREAATAYARGGTTTKVVSVPMWQGSVSFNGPVREPFTMVGRDPAAGGTTTIPTQLLPIVMVFEGTTDPATGNPAELSLDQRTITEVLLGPDFAKAPYSAGITQYADAIQRAEFFPIENSTWHTMLKAPQILPSVTIYVPQNIGGVPTYHLFQATDGTYFALLDDNFFVSQLETILQLERSNPRALLIPMTRNIGLIQNDDLLTCCVVGFHDAYQLPPKNGSAPIQTFAYATWSDASAAAALGYPDFTDIMTLSHEASEWMNDPLAANPVDPAWQFPNSGVCGAFPEQGQLEVGDPIGFVLINHFAGSSIVYPVTVNGFTYHAQIMALFQWFAQVSPSNAIDGAYSYPGESLLTSPSISCP